MITKALLQGRLAEMQAALVQQIANQHATQGAIQLLEQLIAVCIDETSPEDTQQKDGV